MDKETLRGHLPVLVLGMIAEQPRHGYAICKAIRERAPRALRLGDGTLYPLLYRLERRGHIRGKWEEGNGGKPRKVYHITASGRKLIRAHRTDWHALMELFREFLGKEWAKGAISGE